MIEVSELVSKCKDDYHNQLAKKLAETGSKTYWSILKTFYNGKKVLLIPPLLINNKPESNFFKKTNFNNFFCLKMHTAKK